MKKTRVRNQSLKNKTNENKIIHINHRDNFASLLTKTKTAFEKIALIKENEIVSSDENIV